MTFQPLKFILPGLVPEGATLLVARPKFGKSWLVLDIAIAIAAGRFTLGQLKPVQGDVLYLALEDGPRRLQRRLLVVQSLKDYVAPRNGSALG
jgi:RecA-family ATPase